MEYRITITYDGTLDETTGDRLLDELLDRAPDLGPVLFAEPARHGVVLTTRADTRELALAAADRAAGQAVAAIGLDPRAIASGIEPACDGDALALLLA